MRKLKQYITTNNNKAFKKASQEWAFESCINVPKKYLSQHTIYSKKMNVLSIDETKKTIDELKEAIDNLGLHIVVTDKLNTDTFMIEYTYQTFNLNYDIQADIDKEFASTVYPATQKDK
jgi:hypothetical protein